MQANNQFHGQQPLPVLTELDKLYPGIEEELGNRHSHSYSMIKKLFRREFHNCEPKFYVNVKGITRLLSVRHTRFEVTMALENGVTLLVGACSSRPNVAIKLSEDTEALVLDRQGQIISGVEGEEEYCRMVSQAYGSVCQLMPPESLKGACIYYSCNLALGAMIRDEDILMAFILAALVVNDQLQRQPEDIAYELCESLTERECPRYSLYANYSLLLNSSELEEFSLKCGDMRLLITDMFMLQEEAQAISALNRKSLIELRLLEKLLARALNQEEGVDIIEALSRGYATTQFQSLLSESYTVSQCAQLLGDKLDTAPDNVFYPKRKLQSCRQQFDLIREFTLQSDRNGLLRAVNLSYQLKRRQGLVPQRIQHFLKECYNHNALACTLIESKYALLLVDKQCLYILLEFVKKELMLDSQGNERVDSIHSHVFSTLPSCGMGVLDPSMEIWFDDDE